MKKVTKNLTILQISCYQNIKKNANCIVIILIFLAVPTSCKQFLNNIRKAIEESEHINKFHIWEEMDINGINAIFDTLSDLNYKHIISIRFKIYQN